MLAASRRCPFRTVRSATRAALDPGARREALHQGIVIDAGRAEDHREIGDTLHPELISHSTLSAQILTAAFSIRATPTAEINSTSGP